MWVVATLALAVPQALDSKAGVLAQNMGDRAGVLTQDAMPPKTIMLMRHAEKPCREPGSNIAYGGVDLFGIEMTTSLTIKGWIRAGALAHRFGVPSAWGAHALPTPSHLFACRITHAPWHHSRPAQTLLPLACFLNGIVDPRCMRGFGASPAKIVQTAVPFQKGHIEWSKLKTTEATVGPAANSSVAPFVADDALVPLNVAFTHTESAQIGAAILRQGASATVLVSWSHSPLHNITHAIHTGLQALGGHGVRDFEERSNGLAASSLGHDVGADPRGRHRRVHLSPRAAAAAAIG